jgi:NAD+ synthase (glutamine-hydrolysing)
MQDSEQRLFDSIYTHGFARVAVAMPAVDVAAPEFNTDQTLRLARQAASSKAVLATSIREVPLMVLDAGQV